MFIYDHIWIKSLKTPAFQPSSHSTTHPMGKKVKAKVKPKKKDKKRLSPPTPNPFSIPAPQLQEQEPLYVIDGANVVGTFGAYGVQAAAAHFTSKKLEYCVILPLDMDLSLSLVPSSKIKLIDRSLERCADDIAVITTASTHPGKAFIVSNDNFRDHHRKTLKNLPFQTVKAFLDRTVMKYEFASNEFVVSLPKISS